MDRLDYDVIIILLYMMEMVALKYFFSSWPVIRTCFTKCLLVDSNKQSFKKYFYCKM